MRSMIVAGRAGIARVDRVDGAVPCFRLTGVRAVHIGEEGLGREYRNEPLRSATRAGLAASVEGAVPVAFTPCLHAVQRRAASR